MKLSEKEKVKKVDRRTLYTMSVIKDAFLKLLKEKPFNKITIVGIGEEAGITRSTFYLHFDSLTDLLNEVIDEALSLSPSLAQEDYSSTESLVPACQRLGDSPKYQHLFMDPDLSEYIIGRIFQRESKNMVPKIMKKRGISRQDAETIFLYNLHGSFAINRKHHFQKTPAWQHDIQVVEQLSN